MPYQVFYNGGKFAIRVKCVRCERLVGSLNGDDQETTVPVDDITGLSVEMKRTMGSIVCKDCQPEKPPANSVQLFQKTA